MNMPKIQCRVVITTPLIILCMNPNQLWAILIGWKLFAQEGTKVDGQGDILETKHYLTKIIFTTIKVQCWTGREGTQTPHEMFHFQVNDYSKVH